MYATLARSHLVRHRVCSRRRLHAARAQHQRGNLARLAHHRNAESRESLQPDSRVLYRAAVGRGRGVGNLGKKHVVSCGRGDFGVAAASVRKCRVAMVCPVPIV